VASSCGQRLTVTKGVKMDLVTLSAAMTAIGTLAVPVVVAVMAARFNRQVKRWEASQWRNQELIRARLEYFRQLVPKLNDLLCFFDYIGAWQELSPPAMLSLKRALDKEFHCAKPLFSDAIGVKYYAFMDHCFATFGGMGTSAKFRTGFGHRRDAFGPLWNEQWEKMFATAQEPTAAERKAMRDAYDELISAFADDIELTAPRQRYVTMAAPE
jgi:hypothetical protein